MPYSTDKPQPQQIKVFIIFPDGKIGYHHIDKASILAELQAIVGGYIQLAPPLPFYIEHKEQEFQGKPISVAYPHESMVAQIGEYCIVCNEEGIIDRLPPNKGVLDQLLGTVVLCPVSAL
jgi:hypothetical protein